MDFHVAADDRFVSAFPFVIDHLDVGLPRVKALRIGKRAHHLTHVTAIADTLLDKDPRFLSIFKHDASSHDKVGDVVLKSIALNEK
jgi:hypothetical protein